MRTLAAFLMATGSIALIGVLKPTPTPPTYSSGPTEIIFVGHFRCRDLGNSMIKLECIDCEEEPVTFSCVNCRCEPAK